MHNFKYIVTEINSNKGINKLILINFSFTK